MVANNLIDEEILIQSEQLSSKISFTLSFNKFLDRLEEELVSNTQNTDLNGYWLQELKKHKEWLDAADKNDYSSYRPFFEFIQHSSFAAIHAKDLMWGLIQPVYPYSIYATTSLTRLLVQDMQVRLKPGVYINSQEDPQLIWKMMFYSFILQRLYGYSVKSSVDIVAKIDDKETGLSKYFRFEIDTSYLEVTVAGQLPELKIEDISAYDVKGILLDHLEQVLPPEIFSVTGFASMKVIRDTTKSILEEIRAAIIDQTTDSIVQTTKMVLKMLKSLVQNKTVQFGLLPILKLNGKLIDFDLARQLSIVLNTSFAQSLSNQELLNHLEQFNKEPKLVIVNKKSAGGDSLLHGVYENENFKTIAFLPIYHQSLLVGHLEIVNTIDGELTKQINVFALEQVIPFLTELVYRNNMEFNHQISEIVQSRFTSIHPSVLWKMNEAAFVYLKDFISKPDEAHIPDIAFEGVYPFYGIVDITNSTAVRNKATQDDLIKQLNALIITLREINNELDLKILDTMLFACYNWLDVIKKGCTAEIELNIYSFLEIEITPLLNYYNQNFPRVKKSIMRYYETIDPLTGSSYKNRRAIERSMNIINNSINNQIETFANRLQRSYPSYFDSFRTDGVEYNIYLGQSIAPYKVFDDHYLHEYRLLQLISMAEIARNTYSLLPQMDVPLQTTQLIFTSNRPIDINFRHDEKRFDVEGSQNIRYQMIKKRIDKVCIKGTHERLTLAGKIAIVYLDTEIKQEYEKYIAYGQQQGYFKEKVEYLDLEELQDVSGLKAIRLSIRP